MDRIPRMDHLRSLRNFPGVPVGFPSPRAHVSDEAPPKGRPTRHGTPGAFYLASISGEAELLVLRRCSFSFCPSAVLLTQD